MWPIYKYLPSMRTILLFAFLLLSVYSLQSQPPISRGRLIDSDTGEPIRFVQVNYVFDGKTFPLAESDSSGRFVILAVDERPEIVRLMFIKEGYHSEERFLKRGEIDMSDIKMVPYIREIRGRVRNYLDSDIFLPLIQMNYSEENNLKERQLAIEEDGTFKIRTESKGGEKISFRILEPIQLETIQIIPLSSNRFEDILLYEPKKKTGLKILLAAGVGLFGIGAYLAKKESDHYYEKYLNTTGMSRNDHFGEARKWNNFSITGATAAAVCTVVLTFTIGEKNGKNKIPNSFK